MADRSMGIPPTSTTLVPPGVYDLRVHTGCVQGGKFFTVRVNLGYPVTVAELDQRMSADVAIETAQVIRIETVEPDVRPAIPDTVTLTTAEYELMVAFARNSLTALTGVIWARASARLDEITARHG